MNITRRQLAKALGGGLAALFGGAVILAAAKVVLGTKAEFTLRSGIEYIGPFEPPNGLLFENDDGNVTIYEITRPDGPDGVVVRRKVGTIPN